MRVRVFFLLWNMIMPSVYLFSEHTIMIRWCVYCRAVLPNLHMCRACRSCRELEMSLLPRECLHLVICLVFPCVLVQLGVCLTACSRCCFASILTTICLCVPLSRHPWLFSH